MGGQISAISCPRRAAATATDIEPELVEISSDDSEALEDENQGDLYWAGRNSSEVPGCLPQTRAEETGSRWFVVWNFPTQDFAGVHWGAGSTAYWRLREHNNNHIGGIGWKRVEGLGAAQLLYSKKRAELGLPELRYFHWL